MRKPKFKVGDKVRCIKIPNNVNPGSGWRFNLIFTIIKITDAGYDGYIYWEGIEHCGVYEFALAPINAGRKETLQPVIY